MLARHRRCGAVLSFLGLAGGAAASSFNISPIRADLGGTRHTAVLNIANADDEAVVVQVHVAAWSQESGEEHLVDTREILATPPVMQIPGHAEQVVRVALRREPDPTQELTYRVIFEEVPQAAPANFSGLRMALRLSIPVFVAPAQGKAAADVAWEARWLESGTLEVAAVNHGTGHLQVIDFDAQLAGTDGALHGMTSRYVLPGSRVAWRLTSAATAAHTGPIVIHGHSDQGEFSADVADAVR
jgi:fimbrial chaperone protein